MTRILVSVVIALHLSAGLVSAQQPAVDVSLDPRGAPELVVCSQNLENFGIQKLFISRNRGATKDDFRIKLRDLVARFVAAKCDVIAVQELLGDKPERIEEGLKLLAFTLRKRTGRIFDYRYGVSNDKFTRVAFLVAREKATIVQSVSYADVELPKTTPEAKPRFFARGPLEIQLQTPPNDVGISKQVILITFHFKSKLYAYGDPAGLEFETYRMEMAEAIRRIILKRHQKAFATGESILMVLGDRNSHFDTATAEILSGRLELAHFQGEAVCRLSQRGVPLCKRDMRQPQLLFSVFTSDPEMRALPGTYRFRNVFSWLDDILISGEALPFAWNDYASTGNYSSQVIYEPEDASDHALVAVTLNW